MREIRVNLLSVFCGLAINAVFVIALYCTYFVFNDHLLFVNAFELLFGSIIGIVIITKVLTISIYLALDFSIEDSAYFNSKLFVKVLCFECFLAYELYCLIVEEIKEIIRNYIDD